MFSELEEASIWSEEGAKDVLIRGEHLLHGKQMVSSAVFLLHDLPILAHISVVAYLSPQTTETRPM